MIVLKSHFGEETNKACSYLSSRTEMIQTDDNTGNLVQFYRRSRKKCCSMHFVRYNAVTKHTLGIKVSVMTPEPFVFLSSETGNVVSVLTEKITALGARLIKIHQGEREPNNDCYCLTNEGSVFIHRLCLEGFQFIYVSLSICDKMINFRNSLL